MLNQSVMTLSCATWQELRFLGAVRPPAEPLEGAGHRCIVDYETNDQAMSALTCLLCVVPRGRSCGFWGPCDPP